MFDFNQLPTSVLRRRGAIFLSIIIEALPLCIDWSIDFWFYRCVFFFHIRESHINSFPKQGSRHFSLAPLLVYFPSCRMGLFQLSIDLLEKKKSSPIYSYPILVTAL